MVREIITDKELLAQKSEKITDKQEGFDIIKDLIDTAKQYPDCVGLSAPQIGIFKRVIIIKGRNKQWRAMVNPIISQKSKVIETSVEGCMSLPGETYEVKRDRKIHVIYNNNKNQVVKNCFIGFEAFEIQHEIDHLNGVLICDKGTPKL